MILNNIIHKEIEEVAGELGIDVNVAKMAYLSQWLFIKDTIGNLPNLLEINEEEFNKEKTNFNLPSLGKFNTNFKKIQRVKKQKQIINEKTKNKER